MLINLLQGCEKGYYPCGDWNLTDHAKVAAHRCRQIAKQLRVHYDEEAALSWKRKGIQKLGIVIPQMKACSSLMAIM